MRIGMLSDTHGHAARARAAANLLREAGAEAVAHCGDIGGEAVLAELAEVLGAAQVPVVAVLGNVDLFTPSLLAFPGHTGVTVHAAMATAVWDGRTFAVIHGHDGRELERTVASGRFDYVLTGHTHMHEDYRQGPTRVLNPGAVYRSAQPSVALLDTDGDDVRLLPLPG